MNNAPSFKMWIPQRILAPLPGDNERICELVYSILRNTEQKIPFKLHRASVPDWVHRDTLDMLKPPNKNIAHPMMEVLCHITSSDVYWESNQIIQNRHFHDINADLLLFGLTQAEKQTMFENLISVSDNRVIRHKGLFYMTTKFLSIWYKSVFAFAICKYYSANMAINIRKTLNKSKWPLVTEDIGNAFLKKYKEIYKKSNEAFLSNILNGVNPTSFTPALLMYLATTENHYTFEKVIDSWFTKSQNAHNDGYVSPVVYSQAVLSKLPCIYTKASLPSNLEAQINEEVHTHSINDDKNSSIFFV